MDRLCDPRGVLHARDRNRRGLSLCQASGTNDRWRVIGQPPGLAGLPFCHDCWVLLDAQHAETCTDRHCGEGTEGARRMTRLVAGWEKGSHPVLHPIRELPDG